MASFTAVGVAFSTFQKEGKQTAAKSGENASVLCPTSAKVHHRPQQHATQQGPLHPRPGVAHGAVGVSSHSPISLQIVTGMLPDSQDLSSDSPAHE